MENSQKMTIEEAMIRLLDLGAMEREIAQNEYCYGCSRKDAELMALSEVYEIACKIVREYEADIESRNSTGR